MPRTPPDLAERTWQGKILIALRAPINDKTYWGLEWWHESEGTPLSWHNWMATTVSGYGGVNVNSAGVKRYPTVDKGVAATVYTLHLSYYPAIVRAFREGKSLVAIWQAINASPWCKGCQGGKYPTVIYSHLGTNAPNVPGDISGNYPQTPSQDQAWDWSEKVRNAGQRGIQAHPRVSAAVKAMADIRRRG